MLVGGDVLTALASPPPELVDRVLRPALNQDVPDHHRSELCFHCSTGHRCVIIQVNVRFLTLLFVAKSILHFIHDGPDHGGFTPFIVVLLPVQ